ncbi:MAG TPA: DUF2891 family protein [Oryzihumus sp.]|nr:DUF2891 family protein [Oryzihumus sp.]
MSAGDWAQTILRVLGTPWPYNAAHSSLGPDDVDVTPERLHPAFHGSLDWHSSAHMQWSAVRLLSGAAGPLDPATASALAAVLDDRLTPGAGSVEAAYLRRRPSFERPYGWAWAAMLAAATRDCPHPHAATWAQATAPLADAVADLVLAWLPRLTHPVRHGVHSNTAFGCALMHAAYTALGRDDVVTALTAAARGWFGADTAYPASWEPSGNDFLSPGLCEADLMRRVLPAGDRSAWLEAFLPGLGGADDPLLTVPEVRDRTDGQMVHLFGLSLSRAWQLRELAPLVVDPDRRSRLLTAADTQATAVGEEIIDGDFMSTHWLVSFALLAEGARPT